MKFKIHLIVVVVYFISENLTAVSKLKNQLAIIRLPKLP